jgi:hypothetical protein
MTETRFPVAGIAGALFCVVMIYLALQVRAGNDPAIGAGHQKKSPRPILVRRVIITRVVEDDAAPAVAAPATPAAAPAAPAPAPAPAPVVSGGS